MKMVRKFVFQSDEKYLQSCAKIAPKLGENTCQNREKIMLQWRENVDPLQVGEQWPINAWLAFNWFHVYI